MTSLRITTHGQWRMDILCAVSFLMVPQRCITAGAVS